MEGAPRDRLRQEFGYDLSDTGARPGNKLGKQGQVHLLLAAAPTPSSIAWSTDSCSRTSSARRFRPRQRWSGGNGYRTDSARGVAAISRGLRAAIPPVTMTRKYESTPEGSQRPLLRPSGVGMTRETGDRGCRCAQPPANGYHSSGSERPASPIQDVISSLAQCLLGPAHRHVTPPSDFCVRPAASQLPCDDLDPSRRPACAECGRLAQVWEQADAVVAPAPLPVPPPVPVASAPLRAKRSIVPLLSLLCVLIAGGVCWRMEILRRESDRKAQMTAANQVVGAKVEAARAHLARRDFVEALKVLDDALATEHATLLDDARLALLQARQGQANALLDDAADAVVRRNVAKARQLLKDYLAHPFADRKPRATLLLDELARATTDEEVPGLLGANVGRCADDLRRTRSAEWRGGVHRRRDARIVQGHAAPPSAEGT